MNILITGIHGFVGGNIVAALKNQHTIYFDINTGLTQRIYDWFLKSGAKKFIYFSTVKAAADVVPEILTEDIEPSPNIILESYLIFYRITQNRIEVLRVFHSSFCTTTRVRSVRNIRV